MKLVPINIGIKTLHKIIASQIQGFIKRIIYHDQEGFIPKMQGQVNVCKSINIIHHIKKMKNKNHMIISKNDEQNTKAFHD